MSKRRRRSRKNNWLFRKKNPQTYSSFHASLLFELSPLLTIYFVLLAKITSKSTERTRCSACFHLARVASSERVGCPENN